MRRALAALVLCTALAPLGAQALPEYDNGCLVYGEVQGLDTQRTCQYVAASEAQNVYVGTPYDWRVWVLRYNEHGQPMDVTLAQGTGPTLGAPPQVHPEVGETVNVTMSFGCTGPYCGTIGILAVGLENALG